MAYEESFANKKAEGAKYKKCELCALLVRNGQFDHENGVMRSLFSELFNKIRSSGELHFCYRYDSILFNVLYRTIRGIDFFMP